MARFKLDFIIDEVKISEIDDSCNDREGIFYELPNGDEIFLTRDFLKEQSDLLEDFDNIRYEGIKISNVFPRIEGEE